jgi:rRNA processing protein Gar1
LKNWVKLSLFYLGDSKKNCIFRAKRWNKSLEKVTHKPIFTEEYEEIGIIKEIFGPINLPFISVKAHHKTQIKPNNNYYVKTH